MLKLDIKRKFVLMVVLLTAITIAVCFSVSFVMGSISNISLVGDNHMQMAMILANSIYQYAETEMLNIETSAHSLFWSDSINLANKKYASMDPEQIEGYLLGMDKRWIPAGPDDGLVKECLENPLGKMLKRTVKGSPSIREIIITDRFGGLVAASGKTSDYYQADEGWWKDSFSGGKGDIVVSGIEYDESGKCWSISYSLPIRDDQGVIIGICKEVVDISYYFVMLENFTVGKTGHAMVIDSKNNILFHNDVAPMSRAFTGPQSYINRSGMSHGWVIGRDPSMHRDYIFYSWVDIGNRKSEKGTSSWRVFVSQSFYEVAMPLYKAALVSIVAALSLVLLLGFVAYLTGIKFTRTIGILHQALANFSKGKLDYKIKVVSGDELEGLAKAYNDMTVNIKNVLVSKEELTKEMEYRKMAEVGIRERQRILNNILSNIPYSIYWKDRDLKYLGCNINMAKEAGYEVPGELIGKTDDEMPWTAEEAEYCKRIDRGVIDSGLPVLNIERPGLGTDGRHFTVLMSCVPLEDEQGQVLGVLGISADVTDLKTREDELIKSRDKVQCQSKSLDEALKEAMKSREIMVSMLEDNNKVRDELELSLVELKNAQNMLIQSEKLASIGRFVSDIAHEVNNPLMVVSGKAQLSLMEDIGNIEIEDNLKVIVDQCERAKNIIMRLLKFSRPTKPELNMLYVNDHIESVVNLVERQYALDDVKIVRKFTHPLPMTKADSAQLQEVFINLIKNAKEAMPQGGTITIYTAKEERNIRIDIADTGTGISEDHIKYIFDPFYTTKEMGTGLGLSICYGIIKSFGGDIKFKSEPGKNTVATIVMPIAE